MEIVDRITVWVELPEYGYTPLEYELIAPGHGKGWGIGCSLTASGEAARAEDVVPDREEAFKILRMMADGTVTPVSFYDILYDLLP